MGKRSHNSYTYYQCDLTAFPMQRPGSQMPVWKTGEDGKEKLSKVGSYLNNECVMARAEQMASKSEITQETLDRVREYLEARTGVDMRLSAERRWRSSTPRCSSTLAAATRWACSSSAARP